MTGYSGKTKSISDSFTDIIEWTYIFLDEDDAPLPENPLAGVPMWPLPASLRSLLSRTFIMFRSSLLTDLIPSAASRSTPFMNLFR